MVPKRFRTTKSIQELVLVTAADSSHAKSLKNLLISIDKYAGVRTVVWDLGMKTGELEEIKKHAKVTLRKFPFNEFPDYFNISINSGQYAWKAHCIQRIASNFDGHLIWMDAGDLLKSDLKRIRRLISRDGIYITKASGSNTEWTHPGTFTQLRTNKYIQSRSQLSAAFIGLDCGNQKVKALIDKYAEYSSLIEVIAPPGSSRKNHRQDQSIISILAYELLAKTNPMKFITLGFEYFRKPIEFDIHQDVD